MLAADLLCLRFVCVLISLYLGCVLRDWCFCLVTLVLICVLWLVVCCEFDGWLVVSAFLVDLFVVLLGWFSVGLGWFLFSFGLLV